MQRTRRRLRQVLCFIATGLTALTLSDPAGASSPLRSGPPARTLPMVSFAPLIEKVLPAVVSIRVTGEKLLPTELMPGAPVPKPQKRAFRSGGSGVIVNAAVGLIGTNHHVVRDATSIMVGLYDGREAPARLIGVDSGTDIAVIQIDLPDLKSIPFGNSSDLRVGDFIIAIGNPFGLECTATAGIVSGLMRSDIGYDIYESFIQIDAAVNPGNSGGALVNLDGELIGINTAVGRQSGGAVGIAFAIPINMAKRIGRQIYLHGRMRRGSIGLETRDIPSNVAAERKLPNRRGALITAVAPDSPASRAGIMPGSIIVSINGEFVRNNSDYMAHFGSSAVGEEVEFQILRDGVLESLRLTITDQVSAPKTTALAKDVRGLGGLVVSDIGPRSPLYGQLRGAIISSIEPDSPAIASGLRANDVIVAVNQLTISEARQIVDLTQSDLPIERLRITRQGIPYIVELQR